MKKYFHDEKFEFLVVKTFDMGCYGFNSKHTDQGATAKKIIQHVNSFIVNGWKLHSKFRNGFIVTMHGMTS